MDDDSAFPPDVATRLGVANHYGHAIRGGESREDAAVSALYLSKVQPGQHFLVRANRPGYVAEPDRAGKRRITETGLWALSPKQAYKWTRRHITQAAVGEMRQRAHQNGQVNKARLVGTLRELQATQRRA
jgi:hypothetical protein